MGDNAYARYTAALGPHHPGDAVPTEREYWRERYAEQDANPVPAAAERGAGGGGRRHTRSARRPTRSGVRHTR